MNIDYLEDQHMFHLQTKHMSYLLRVVRGNQLAHCYWGPRLETSALDYLPQYIHRGSFSPNPLPEDTNLSYDQLPREFPGYGDTDFRSPALEVEFADGSSVTHLEFVGYRIHRGKPKLTGLPATYVETNEDAVSLEVDLVDPVSQLSATLLYTVFTEHDVLVRSVSVQNGGAEPVLLRRILSASVDFPDSAYDLIQLSGTWGRERDVVTRRLVPGTQSIESRRGASSHQQNPFFALAESGTTLRHGQVFAFNLVYSGSFLASVEVDAFAQARAQIGINPFDFHWYLEPGETFQAPECVMVESSDGLTGMAQAFHRFYRKHLLRGTHRDTERPILVNNWEATYFQFDEDTLLDLAGVAAEVGAELFVLDDGWFGKRDSDRSSLGDWDVNLEKLPNGIVGLAERVHGLGMKFGLWFEPEMVSPDSALYRAHPEWTLQVQNRPQSEGRHQLVLDLSRPDVCDHLIERVGNVLASGPIDYVKWDMNRHMTEVGSLALPAHRQRETAHRYMLGLYRVLETLTERFPHVLMESCSGGGGRFDPGMLYYMPQTWTSDNTDAVARLRIQYGTSLVYPAVTAGAHVSAVPNHQVGRMTDLRTRAHVAMAGNFGYELDLTALPKSDLREIRSQIEWYKTIRPVVQFGDYYPLKSPFEGEGNDSAWMYLSTDGRVGVVTYVHVLAIANDAARRLCLTALEREARYRLEEMDGASVVRSGSELMQIGILLPVVRGDFQSWMWRLERLDETRGE
ncbi:alpha-galactosidase [Alicyclobacillus sp. SP_1]|uniref:alpha-galactosidase n=1 Tax=Alicyclobacillus sp. SP_1 TaxID=2942475 RepID=UPI0035BE7041